MRSLSINAARKSLRAAKQVAQALVDVLKATLLGEGVEVLPEVPDVSLELLVALLVPGVSEVLVRVRWVGNRDDSRRGLNQHQDRRHDVAQAGA